MLLRLAYIAVTNAFAALRLLPIGDRDRDIEILALRHQITVLERQLGPNKAMFAPEDRAFLAALLSPLPREALRRPRLLVQPDTVRDRARHPADPRLGNDPAVIDEILTDAGIQTVLTGIRVPRMNSVMERWVQSCRHELLDRTPIWNEHHLRHALREYEKFYNSHRAHQARHQAAPLRPVPAPITDPDRIAHLNMRRQDRLGGVLHEYLHAA